MYIGCLFMSQCCAEMPEPELSIEFINQDDKARIIMYSACMETSVLASSFKIVPAKGIQFHQFLHIILEPSKTFPASAEMLLKASKAAYRADKVI